MEKSKAKKKKKGKKGKNITLELKFYDHSLLCQKFDMQLHSKFAQGKNMKVNTWIGITTSIEEEQLVQRKKAMTYLSEANNMYQKEISSIGEKELEPHDRGKKLWINKRLFKINSRISLLKIMIPFAFDFPLIF
jgi:hypothetical protein